jgi:hypothetical protein
LLLCCAGRLPLVSERKRRGKAGNEIGPEQDTL